METTISKDSILAELKKWPLCDYFLRKGLQKLTQSEIHRDGQFFKYFLDSRQMQRLENMISGGLQAFGKTKEELRRTRQYGFSGKFDKENFESFRGVLRTGPALRRQGFTHLTLVDGPSLADICAQHNRTKWAIEVKTLVYRGRDWTAGELGGQKKDKIDWVAKKILKRDISGAKRQLARLAAKQGCSEQMLVEVLNRDFVVGLFFNDNDFACVYRKLCEAGSLPTSITHVGFLADGRIHFFPSLPQANG